MKLLPYGLLLLFSVAVFSACGGNATATPDEIRQPTGTSTHSATIPLTGQTPNNAESQEPTATHAPATPTMGQTPDRGRSLEPTPTSPSSAAATDASPTATTGAPTATLPPDLADQVPLQRISDSLTQARGLDFLRPVEPEFLSAAGLGEYLRSNITEDDRLELSQLQQLYQALGLIEPTIDLETLYLSLLEEQVAGLFNLEDEKLLVVTESLPLGVSEEITLAHELAHALQQQHFDARALLEDAGSNQDALLAIDALLEGDATFASALYAAANFTLADLMDLTNDLPGTPVFDNAPPVLKKTLLFPYEGGSQFVSFIWQQQRDWQNVDQVYATPPASSEQILHPEKYLAGEEPRETSLPPFQEVIGSGWTPVIEDALGEFMLRVYLESGVEDDLAQRAAAGWGGDRFALWRNDQGAQIFVSLTQWDSEADAAEFFAAYQVFGDSKESWSGISVTASTISWEQPATSQIVSVSRQEDQTMLVIAPSAPLNQGLLSLFLD